MSSHHERNSLDATARVRPDAAEVAVRPIACGAHHAQASPLPPLRCSIAGPPSYGKPPFLAPVRDSLASLDTLGDCHAGALPRSESGGNVSVSLRHRSAGAWPSSRPSRASGSISCRGSLSTPSTRRGKTSESSRSSRIFRGHAPIAHFQTGPADAGGYTCAACGAEEVALVETAGWLRGVAVPSTRSAAATAAAAAAAVAAAAAARGGVAAALLAALATAALALLGAVALRWRAARRATQRAAAAAAAARGALVRRRAAEIAALQERVMLNVTHELNTPLHELLGCLEALTSDPLPPPARRLMCTAAAAGRRAAHALRAMLDASRLRAVPLRLARAAVPLSHVLPRLAALPWDSARPHRRLRFALVDAAFDAVDADEGYLMQALYELVSNAFKFSEGDVHVTVAPGPPASAVAATRVTVSVADSGRGIAAADLPAIWEPFCQGAAGADCRVRPVEGLGLGLHIAYEILAAHGAPPECTSRAGEGTVISFHMHRHVDTPPPAAPPPRGVAAPGAAAAPRRRPAGPPNAQLRRPCAEPPRRPTPPAAAAAARITRPPPGLWEAPAVPSPPPLSLLLENSFADEPTGEPAPPAPRAAAAAMLTCTCGGMCGFACDALGDAASDATWALGVTPIVVKPPRRRAPPAAAAARVRCRDIVADLRSGAFFAPDHTDTDSPERSVSPPFRAALHATAAAASSAGDSASSSQTISTSSSSNPPPDSPAAMRPPEPVPPPLPPVRAPFASSAFFATAAVRACDALDSPPPLPGASNSTAAAYAPASRSHDDNPFPAAPRPIPAPSGAAAALVLPRASIDLGLMAPTTFGSPPLVTTPCATPPQAHPRTRGASVDACRTLPRDTSPDAARAGPPTILCVDDNAVNLLVIARMLQSAGMRVIKAMSGAEALKRLGSSERLPDLMIMDVMMPGISGLDLCREVRKRYPDIVLPSIFVSSNSQPEHIVDGLAAGAQDYMTKPVNRSELIARVRVHLRMKDRVHRAAEGIAFELLTRHGGARARSFMSAEVLSSVASSARSNGLQFGASSGQAHVLEALDAAW